MDVYIKPKPVKKAKGLVPSPINDWRKRDTYKPGDGDSPRYIRPGSDHSHLKSFGTLC